eukprot:47194-Eustigmatos_ZCMA.PRE.1
MEPEAGPEPVPAARPQLCDAKVKFQTRPILHRALVCLNKGSIPGLKHCLWDYSDRWRFMARWQQIL